jgi:hypothetical protein
MRACELPTLAINAIAFLLLTELNVTPCMVTLDGVFV